MVVEPRHVSLPGTSGEKRLRDTPPFTVGDHVTYADINLHDYRGVIVALGPQQYGGDCLVAWVRPVRGTTIECRQHLRLRPR